MTARNATALREHLATVTAPVPPYIRFGDILFVRHGDKVEFQRADDVIGVWLDVIELAEDDAMFTEEVIGGSRCGVLTFRETYGECRTLRYAVIGTDSERPHIVIAARLVDEP